MVGSFPEGPPPPENYKPLLEDLLRTLDHLAEVETALKGKHLPPNLWDEILELNKKFSPFNPTQAVNSRLNKAAEEWLFSHNTITRNHYRESLSGTLRSLSRIATCLTLGN